MERAVEIDRRERDIALDIAADFTPHQVIPLPQPHLSFVTLCRWPADTIRVPMHEHVSGVPG